MVSQSDNTWATTNVIIIARQNVKWSTVLGVLHYARVSETHMVSHMSHYKSDSISVCTCAITNSDQSLRLCQSPLFALHVRWYLTAKAQIYGLHSTHVDYSAGRGFQVASGSRHYQNTKTSSATSCWECAGSTTEIHYRQQRVKYPKQEAEQHFDLACSNSRLDHNIVKDAFSRHIFRLNRTCFKHIQWPKNSLKWQ